MLSPISRNNTAFWRAAARQEMYGVFKEPPWSKGAVKGQEAKGVGRAAEHALPWAVCRAGLL